MSLESLAQKIEQFFPGEKEYVLKKLSAKIKKYDFKKNQKNLLPKEIRFL